MARSSLSPANYDIRVRPTADWDRREIEYLNSMERPNYSINQYACPNVQALEQKIIQFPAGSLFDFSYDFSVADPDELLDISDFLSHHGYKVRTLRNSSFLRPASPH